MYINLVYKETSIPIDCDALQKSSYLLEYNEQDNKYSIPLNLQSLINNDVPIGFSLHPFGAALHDACRKLNDITKRYIPRNLVQIQVDREASDFLALTVEAYLYRSQAFYELRYLQGLIREHDNGLPTELYGFPVVIVG